MKKTERNNLIVKLHNAGITLEVIGNLFGISRQRVWQVYQNTPQKSGFRKSWDDGIEKKIRKWYRQGLAMDEIIQGVRALSEKALSKKHKRKK